MEDEEEDPFEGLGWGIEIVRLADPHIPFNPAKEHGVSGVKRYRDDYEMTPFSQSTQAWKSRVEEEEQQQYAERLRMRADRVQEQMESTTGCKVEDVIDLRADIVWTQIEMDGEEESNGEDEEVKDVADPSRALSFCEKMKRLSPHRLPLKERMKDCTISYVDLLRSDPLPRRDNDDPVQQGCRKLLQ